MEPSGPGEDAERVAWALRHLIRRDPGPTLRSLRMALGIDHHQLLRHLLPLEEAREVVRLPFRNRIHVLPRAAQEEGWWRQLVALRQTRSADIHGWIDVHGPCRQCDVAGHFRTEADLHLSTVQARLRDLEEARLLTKFRRDSAAKWAWYTAHAPHPKVRDLMDGADQG